MKNYLCIIFSLILLSTGCDELDVAPPLSDGEEIERYIADSDIGRDFFRKNNIILETAYTFDDDSGAIFIDQVDSIDRDINIYFALDNIGTTFTQKEQDHGSPYFVKRDAEVNVTDRFYITTIRIFQNDTTEISNLRNFTRFGYFMKLGDDGQRFSGWQLIGFSSDASLAGGYGPVIQKADNSTFNGSVSGLLPFKSNIYDADNPTRDTIRHETNNRYYQLVGSQQPLERLVNGEQLTVLTNILLYDQTIVSAETSSGHLYQALKSQSIDSTGFSFQTPTSHSKTWNIICFNNLYGSDNDTLNILPINQITGEINCAAYRVD